MMTKSIMMMMMTIMMTNIGNDDFDDDGGGDNDSWQYDLRRHIAHRSDERVSEFRRVVQSFRDSKVRDLDVS